MAKNEVGARAGKKRVESVNPKFKSIVKTSAEFKAVMSELMKGVLCGEVTANQANAACNAGGKLLKVVELELKYKTDPGGMRMIN